MAVMIRGYFDGLGRFVKDPAKVTFACPKSAIVDCIQEFNAGPSEPKAFQACTRMARADYCGNGWPHTHTGTLINAYGHRELKKNCGNGMCREADWGPDGAICMSRLRYEALSLEDNPACRNKLAPPPRAGAANPSEARPLPIGQAETLIASCRNQAGADKANAKFFTNRSWINTWNAKLDTSVPTLCPSSSPDPDCNGAQISGSSR
jgi:ADYC domain